MDHVLDFLSQAEVDDLLKGVTEESSEDWAAAMEGSGDTRTRHQLIENLVMQFNYEINRQNLVIEEARARIDAIVWCIDMIEGQK